MGNGMSKSEKQKKIVSLIENKDYKKLNHALETNKIPPLTKMNDCGVRYCSHPAEEIYIIHYIVARAMPYVLRFLLTCQFKDMVDQKTDSKKTPLMYAVLHQKVDHIDILKEFHAEVNARDVDGYTALHFACRTGSVAIVQALRKFDNLQVNIKNCHGNTPYDEARHYKHDDVMHLLLRFQEGGLVSTADSGIDETPVYQGASSDEVRRPQSKMGSRPEPPAYQDDLPLGASARNDGNNLYDEVMPRSGQHSKQSETAGQTSKPKAALLRDKTPKKVVNKSEVRIDKDDKDVGAQATKASSLLRDKSVPVYDRGVSDELDKPVLPQDDASVEDTSWQSDKDKGDGLLCDKYAQKIKKNYHKFCLYLKIDEVLPLMFANELFTKHVHDKIRSHQQCSEKIKELIEILYTLTDKKFEEFLEILIETKQDALANEIKNTKVLGYGRNTIHVDNCEAEATPGSTSSLRRTKSERLASSCVNLTQLNTLDHTFVTEAEEV